MLTENRLKTTRISKVMDACRRSALQDACRPRSATSLEGGGNQIGLIRVSGGVESGLGYRWSDLGSLLRDVALLILSSPQDAHQPRQEEGRAILASVHLQGALAFLLRVPSA